MSDTVKLIIEIPKEEYEYIKALSDVAIAPNTYSILVKNGIPLDTVKAEIKEKCDNINHITSHLPYSTHRFVQELLCEILASIDNEESEDKE